MLPATNELGHLNDEPKPPETGTNELADVMTDEPKPPETSTNALAEVLGEILLANSDGYVVEPVPACPIPAVPIPVVKPVPARMDDDSCSETGSSYSYSYSYSQSTPHPITTLFSGKRDDTVPVPDEIPESHHTFTQPCTPQTIEKLFGTVTNTVKDNKGGSSAPCVRTSPMNLQMELAVNAAFNVAPIDPLAQFADYDPDDIEAEESHPVKTTRSTKVPHEFNKFTEMKLADDTFNMHMTRAARFELAKDAFETHIEAS